MSSTEVDFDLVEIDDYYAWLGLNKRASPDEINNAFRKLSRIYHPDKHASSPSMLEKAEEMFPKIKKAHDILSDAHKRAIYDTTGVKGLETEGWEVVSRTKTPQEILEEYERLAKEREERKLEQKTNPKGTLVLGIDATELFDRYEALDAEEYSSILPHIEISDMAISQSVECPLTTKDTAVISGSLSSRNGRGHGNISVTGRRLLSSTGWTEVEIGAGEGASISIRGFRTLWRRSFGTMSGSLQFSPHGHVAVLRPGFSTMVATQLDKNTQGRLTYNYGHHSSMSSMVIWDNSNHHLSCALQFGIPATYLAISYTRKFLEEEAKVRGTIRLGTFGVSAEYGCDKKITQFSNLGASLSVGIPLGVTLKIKLHRGNQSYVIPIHLADDIVPSAVFYGTLLPIAAYFAIKVLIVKPFIKDQKDQDLQKKKDANSTRLAEKRREAELSIDLMKETFDRIIQAEEKKGGLVMRKGLYGKLEGESIGDTDMINITVPLQALVKDSKLLLPEGTHLSELPGFYDPCIGEDKELSITYEFRRQLHIGLFKEGEKILLPNKEHLVNSPSPEETR